MIPSLRWSRSGFNEEGEDYEKKEFVVADEEIGVTFDLDTGDGSITNRFAIHFGKKGWHIVPVKRKKD